MNVVVAASVATAVLVEGESDRHAVETLARRQGRVLADERVAVVPMGGATNIGHFLEELGPRGRGLRLAGLCDAGEEGEYRRRLARAGLGAPADRDAMEALGFFVCERDLEDEMIRAIGAARVERLLDEQGELGSFRTFQKQPAQLARPLDAQLRRFLGTRSGRKTRYGQLLAGAVALDALPRPLARLLAYV